MLDERLARRVGPTVVVGRDIAAHLRDLLDERKVPVHTDTPEKIAEGRTSGERTFRRVDVAKALEADNPEGKDKHYLDIASIGVVRRRFQLTDNPHRLSSRFFAEDLAGEAGYDYYILNDILRAMRSDFLLSQLSAEGAAIEGTFRSVTELYFSNFLSGRNQPPELQRIDAAWDRKSPFDFYRLMGEDSVQPPTFGTWPPYEVEIFAAFYQHRLDQQSGLSFYDRAVLTAERDGIPDERSTGVLRTLTGIRYEKGVTNAHLNALLGNFSKRPEASK